MNPQNNQLPTYGITLLLCKKIICLLILFSSTVVFSQDNQQLAFPTATGAAAYTTGGRGSTVYKVTNLNNSGTGSFRDAVSVSNRIIIFEVSGTIELTSNLSITRDNLTIAGQSAPEGGITITGKPVYFQNTNNIILRYIRFRPDFNSSGNVDALNAYNCSNIIIDHCSISWSGDEAISLIGNSSNVTLQNCIMGESSTGMLAGDSNNPTSNNFSIVGNLWYNISHRFPNVNALRTDVINNVVHNWYTRLMVVSAHDNTYLNEINNYYQAGTKTGEPRSPNWSVNWLDVGSASQRDNIRIYTNGNVYPSFLTEEEEDWSLYVHRFNINSGQYAGTDQWDDGDTDFNLQTSLDLLGQAPSITTANEALINVPINAGANKYLDGNGNSFTYRDDIDETYVTNVANGTSEPYSYPPTNIVNKESYVNFHNSVSSTPMNSHASDFYSSLDGIPNSWKELKNLDLNTDYSTFEWPSGYIGIEEYLNEVDSPETAANQVALVSDVTNNTLCEGESTILTASGAVSYVWNTGETATTLEVMPDVTTTYTVTGTHSDGSSTQAEITITVNQTPTANAGEDTETCLGTPVTLTATGGSSYQWSNGGTSASITVNPNTTTTYTVEVFENNCSSTDEITVTVNEIPDVEAGDDQTIFEGESATLTATGADSYVWSTGETTESITVNPLLDTSYFVTGTTNNCENTDSVTVFLLDDSVNANAGADTEICIGESTTLTATGGTTYVWNTGETTASIEVSPTEITTYTVTAYSASGANFEDDSVIVTVNQLPIADAGEDVEICFGNVTTLTASGGTSYLWSTGETTDTISVNPDTTTTYSVEVTSNNCSSTDEVTVIVNDLPETNAGNDISIFDGASTTLTASGADSYVWSTGETTESITVSPTNTTIYSVTGTSVQGCEFVDTVIVTILSDDVTANAGDDTIICNGESTTLTASGGTTYLWSTGETTASIEVSPTTTTTYTVTAYSMSGNNSDEDSAIVTVNQLPIADAGEDVEICFGNVTTLTASGGTSYLWSTGETTQTISVNPTENTIYTVEVFENNCSSIDQTQVTVNALPNTNAGTNVTITEGESTTLTASGADSYVWSTGETTTSITVSPATTTTYSVVGTAANGCQSSDDVIVSVGVEAINANAGADVTICDGEMTTLTATGGSTYLWDTGETTASITVNPNQTTEYTVTVFNEAQTASDNDSVIVLVNPLPETNAGNDVTIFEGDATTLTASGADSYVWSTGETTTSISVSPTSTTTYTVTGISNGCESSDDVIVSVETENINANAGADVTICDGEMTTLTATGGSTYLWDTGETTASITVNPNQTTEYTVTVFNEAQTASDNDSVTVLVNPLPETNAGNDVTIFEGDATTLTASGADSYVWSTGETTTSISVSPTSTTTYSVIGVSNGCESSDDVIVSVETENINANAGADVAICNGESTILTASGGVTYLWNTGETTATIEVSPIATTTYTVTAFSANGSESNDDSVTVTVNDIPVADAGNDVTICFGNETTLTASGGSTYLWSTGETTQNITVNPNSTTTYIVEVFTNNCSSTDDVIITVNDLPQTNAGADITIVEGDSTTLTATGAESYVWSTGETTSSISVNPLITTTYTVSGISNGCETIDDVIVIVEPFVFTASAGADQTICQGYETTLTASEGDSYLWSTGETTQSITVNPSNTQTYTVTVFEGDYQADAEVQVGVNPNPNVVITNGNDVMILEGEFITLSASGANTYAWNNGATQPNIAVSPSITTTYEVTGFINNCEDTTAVLVNVLEIVEADAGEDLIICNEEIVTLTATGGDEYLWSNGETTQSIEVSPDVDTEYSVLVYNALDSDEDTVMVFVEECSTIENPVESEEFGFLIYQDPTTDILKVRIDGLQSVTATGFSIYSIGGKIIYTESFNQNEMQDLSQMTRELDVSTYSRGIYIVKLDYNDTSVLKKTAIK
ncbi:T9SS type A sorting domain-containing protein [Psychroserpens sp. AS72]|uniref:T9SS type A sorting domain-containing protein n=1 Tax=Psychroserpens sp. AS72 TaxID=3135775 RepID=UPI0031770BC2